MSKVTVELPSFEVCDQIRDEHILQWMTWLLEFRLKQEEQGCVCLPGFRHKHDWLCSHHQSFNDEEVFRYHRSVNCDDKLRFSPRLQRRSTLCDDDLVDQIIQNLDISKGEVETDWGYYYSEEVMKLRRLGTNHLDHFPRSEIRASFAPSTFTHDDRIHPLINYTHRDQASRVDRWWTVIAISSERRRVSEPGWIEVATKVILHLAIIQ